MIDGFAELLSNGAAALGAFTLRDYQLRALRLLAEALQAGSLAPLIQAPTGAGKSTIAAAIVVRAREANMSVLFLAHRRELINHAFDRCAASGLDPRQMGVIMSTDPRCRPGLPVQIASIDTLRYRQLPRADLVIIDECHRSLSPSLRALLGQYPGAIKLGLTATPFRADGQALGEVFTRLVQVATVKELIALGALVEPRCFTVPPEQMPDLSSVAVRRGDYDERALADAMDRAPLVGNIVEHWLKLANDVPTVVFATNIAHSRHILTRFQEAGVSSEHLDGETPTSDRDAILARLEGGQTRVVSSVMCLAEGWDQPSVKCAILARPTKSLGLYLQQAGRILRPFEGQQAVILDHAGCVLEHGLPQDDREYSLKPKPKRARNAEALPPPVRACEECHALLPIQTRTCPECGTSLAPPRGAPSEQAGELVEVNEHSPALRHAEWRRLCGVAKRQGFNPQWIRHRFRERFGEEPGPEFELPRWLPRTPEQKRSYFKSLLVSEPNIRWARARYRVELGEPTPI
jgi:DNA repair protein RadD